MSRYLINGDVADRGKHAVEILLVIFALMLAAPRTIHFNRGNHESLDMNVRSFREGGGFATEVGAKYGSDAFTLFQASSRALEPRPGATPWSRASTRHPRHSCTRAPRPCPHARPHAYARTCAVSRDVRRQDLLVDVRRLVLRCAGRSRS